MGSFLKKSRHFKSKTIISSQYPNDLDIDARMQLKYWLVFKKISEAKLKEIYLNTDLDIPYDHFISLYDYAVSKPYSFLYIDTILPEFRQGFDTEINISE
jgi:hypothetical protein